MTVRIDVPRERLAEFTQRRHIRRLALFGSILREDFGSDSDIDVLVEFEPGHVPGFIGMAEIELELSGILLGGRWICARRRSSATTSAGKSSRKRRRSMAEDDVVRLRARCLASASRCSGIGGTRAWRDMSSQ